MATEGGQTEALKMLADWCKWAITVETGALALIGSIASKDYLSKGFAVCGTISVGAFASSMAVALILLSALPIALQDIEPGQRVFDREVYLLMRPIGKFYVYAYWLAGTFMVGICSFAVGVGIQLVTKHA